MPWIYNNKDVYNIRVVNISMNTTVAQSRSGDLDIHSAGKGTTTESASQDIMPVLPAMPLTTSEVLAGTLSPGTTGKGKTMKTQILIKVSGITLLGVAVSLALLLLVYALQNPQLMLMLFTVSWNG